MSQSVGDVLLVGSVPLDSAEEVFKTCAEGLGDHLQLYPDGEVGARKSWIQCQAKFVFDRHPAIDTVKRPRSDDGFPREYDDNWIFRLRSGTEGIHFDDLKYAGWASESYATFHGLRAQGAIPRGARFQVSLPTPVGGSTPFFDQPRDRELVCDAYELAMMREVGEICRRIPHEDLAIQWDVCVEVLEIAAAEQTQTHAGDRPSLANLLTPDPWIRAAAQFERISTAIPPAVMLGFHFCYGDLAHHHLVEPENLALSVRMANLAISHSVRPVSWIHMPVPIGRADEAYFAPLRELSSRDAAVFLGLIHLHDGVEGSVKRAAAAKSFLQKFGVATECGLGRRPRETLVDVLRIHREVADRLVRGF
jgi:methionine synthase II (cobalamin-independent)